MHYFSKQNNVSRPDMRNPEDRVKKADNLFAASYRRLSIRNQGHVQNSTNFLDGWIYLKKQRQTLKL